MTDGLHIRNHKRTSCKTDLGPHGFDEMYPELKETRNSMAAEQVFIWLVIFKKILAAMPKEKHLSYLHRAIIRRNEYIGKRLRAKRPVMTPKPSLN